MENHEFLGDAPAAKQPDEGATVFKSRLQAKRLERMQQRQVASVNRQEMAVKAATLRFEDPAVREQSLMKTLCSPFFPLYISHGANLTEIATWRREPEEAAAEICCACSATFKPFSSAGNSRVNGDGSQATNASRCASCAHELQWHCVGCS
jgi:hypothetical protein